MIDNLEPQKLLQALSHGAIFLPFARAFGLTLLVPIAWNVIGLGLRMSISFCMAVFVSDRILAVSPTISSILSEIILGMVLSLPLYVLINTGLMLGELSDTARGQSIGSLYNPTIESEASSMGQLIQSALWAKLSLLLIFPALMSSYVMSFKNLPVAASVLQNSLAFNLLLQITKLLQAGFAVLMPLFVVLVILELLLGLLPRLVPNLNLTQEGFIFKSGVTFSTLLILEQYPVDNLVKRFIYSLPWLDGSLL